MNQLQIKAIFSILILSLTLFSGMNCVANSIEDQDTPEVIFLCNTLGICSNIANVKFGMVGDSWTDFYLGSELIKTIRPNLEDNYGFELTGATLGGQTLENVLSFGLHEQVIYNAGEPIKYMLISLGGNDLNLNALYYQLDPEAEKSRVTANIKNMFLELVDSGNDYKKALYGGDNLKWIIHGYDYLNPDNSYSNGLITSTDRCREYWLEHGLTSADDVNTEVQELMESYNQMLAELAAENDDIEYINLLGTLGGPSVSDSSLMTDCIHPTDTGFANITSEYVKQLDEITGGER